MPTNSYLLRLKPAPLEATERGTPSFQRAGFTLVEMVVVLAVLCALGATSLTVLQTLNKTSQHAVSHSAGVRDTQRLADALRVLTHTTSTAEVQDNGESLVLTDERYRHHFRVSSDGQAIDYSAEPLSNDLPARHDRYTIDECSEFTFKLEENPSLIAVQWTRVDASPIPLRIEAMLAAEANP